MARPSNAVPWALIALVSGGLIYKPAAAIVRPAAAAVAAPSDAGQDETANPAKPHKKSDAVAKDSHRDALDVLGEYYGIDLSDEGMLQRAVESAQVLLYGTHAAGAGDRKDQGKALLDALKISSGSVPLSEATRSRVTELLAARFDRPSDDAATLAWKKAGAVSGAREFLSDYFWRDRDSVRLLLLKKLAGTLDVQTVVATLPDPIDSNVRWLFDPMVESIQRAAGDARYVLDRFYIPDWTPESGSQDHSSEPRGAHERWPGVVLFRSTEPGRPALLMVFLVSETATSGVHQVAFERALTYSAMVRRACGKPATDLAILGPSFSGSVDSMLKTFGRVAANDPETSFRIVTGGATDDGIRSAIERAMPGRATFRSTVLPNGMLLAGLQTHLLRVDPDLAKPGAVAILEEANTAYGLSARDTINGTGPVSNQSVFNQALHLPFPMHISRLRSEAPASPPEREAASPAVPSRFHTLALEEPGTPTDQIPAFSPKLTASSVELMLANIIDTIRREHVRVVGLIATDARDKLFLAKQLSQFAPGVMLFTLESDLMFVHPDYNKYVRGMLVVSSYPLFMQNQSFTTPAWWRRRQQFPTTNSEGVYNALLALIAYDISGNRRPWSPPPPPLLDYRPAAPTGCFAHGCIPPVWISVVAADALWPVGSAFPVGTVEGRGSDSRHPAMFLAPEPAAMVQLADIGASPAATFVRASWPMAFLLVGFAAVAFAAVALFVQWRRLGDRAGSGSGFARAAQALRYQRVALITIAAAGLPVAWTSYAAWSITAGLPLSIEHVLYALAISGELAVAVTALVASLWKSGPRELLDGVSLKVCIWRTLTFGAGLAIALFGGWRLLQHVWRLTLEPPTMLKYTRLTQRSLEPGNGVSPLVPVLLLATPILAWALLQLWCVGGPRLNPVFDSKWIGTLAARLDATWRERLRHSWRSPTCGLPAPYLEMVFAGLTVTALLCLRVHTMTIEPLGFSQFLVAAWLLVQLVIALTLAHAVHLWTLNRRLLRAIAASPLLEAFGRLPKDTVFHGAYSPAPRRSDLVRPTRFFCALADAVGSLDAVKIAAAKPAFAAVAASPRPGGLESMTHVPWANTDAFRTLMTDGDAIFGVLEARWTAASTTFLLRKRDIETDDAVEQWTLRAEELLAMLLTLVIRQIMSRVVRGLAFVTLALVLVVTALVSFPIYPVQPLIGCAWAWVGVAAVAGVWVSVTMERDPVLSRLTGTTPNRVTWNLAFATKMIVYVGIPVLTLFATQFPEVGGAILNLVTPIQPLP